MNDCKHKDCINCPDDILIMDAKTIKYINDHNIWITYHHKQFPCWDVCSLNNEKYPRGKDLFGNII